MKFSRAQLLELVRKEFGPHLERISPAGAREFLDRLYREFHIACHPTGIIEIEEAARSYEEIMGEFFTQTLTMGAEDAAVMLWLHSFEQHFATIEEAYSERFIALFEESENLSEDEDEQA